MLATDVEYMPDEQPITHHGFITCLVDTSSCKKPRKDHLHDSSPMTGPYCSGGQDRIVVRLRHDRVSRAVQILKVPTSNQPTNRIVFPSLLARSLVSSRLTTSWLLQLDAVVVLGK
jgi:hypothetical protein